MLIVAKYVQNNRRLKFDKTWYRYIYPKNLLLFASEKLIAPEIAMGGQFSYDKKGEFYSTTTIYGYIKKSGVKESYIYLLALLNSNLLWWFLRQTGTVLANGYFRFKPNYLFPFPIPNVTATEVAEIERLAIQCLTLPSEKTAKEIDAMIYSLYHLTSDDVAIIENS